MNQTVLIIDDIAVDLADNTVIAITKQVNDIAELKDRQADYSTQFKLPYTQTNRQVINGANIFQSSTRTQYRKLPAKLLQNGIESLGYIAVAAATDNGFECVFYSGNLNFFSVIQGKKLSDLDLSSAEHAWTCPNVFAARLHQWNVGGYIYPIVDTVNDGIQFNYVDSEIDFRWLTPWLFVKFIWQAIFDAAGFEYEGKFLSSKKFENAITNLETNKHIAEPVGSGYEIAATPYYFPEDDVDATFLYVKFSTTVTDPLLQNQIMTHSGNDSPTRGFRPVNNGKYSFQCTIAIDYQPPLFSFVDRVEVHIHDATTGSLTGTYLRTTDIFYNTDFYSSGHFSSFQPFLLDIEDVDMTTDEVMVVKIILNGPPSYAFNSLLMTAATRFVLTKTVHDEMLPGDIFKIAENLYDMEQTEFIKGIMQRFCLTCDTDSYYQKVKFYQFSEVIDNIPNARDWSEKLNQKSKVTFRDNTYAQNNFMRWTQSKEYEEIKEWGDHYFPIDDEVLTLKKDVLTLKFVSSKRVIRMYGRYMPCVVFHDPSTAPEFGVWTEKVGPRLLILDRDSFTPPITLLDPIFSTPQTFVTDIPMAYFKHDTLDDLTWEDGIENEYADLVKALQLYKKGDMEFYLKPSDVSNFDFSIPIYIDKYSSYFYVNKISNFVAGKAVTVELVKIT